MSQNVSEQRRADDRALLLLAAGRTVTAAAKATGISRRTLTRRLRNARFRERLQRLRAEMFERGAAILAAAQTSAAKTLVRLLRSEEAKIRLGASRSIFEMGAKARESVEMAERVSALEQHLLITKGKS
jgi:hypothetical protein